MDPRGSTTGRTTDGVVVAGCFLGSFVVFGLSYAFGELFEPKLRAFVAAVGGSGAVALAARWRT